MKHTNHGPFATKSNTILIRRFSYNSRTRVLFFVHAHYGKKAFGIDMACGGVYSLCASAHAKTLRFDAGLSTASGRARFYVRIRTDQ